MGALSNAKTKLTWALVEFSNICKIHGQNGLISAGITEAILESIDKEQIEIIINNLNKNEG